MTSRMSRLGGLLLVLALATSACSGTEDPPAGSETTGTTTTTAATPTDTASVDPNLAYGLDLPPGVQLTALGSDLTLGDEATVAWQPKIGKVGVLSITVTKLVQSTIKDFRGFTLDERSRNSTPYYVYVTATNAGTLDLAGIKVPLYIENANGDLVESTEFTSAFKPCASTPLPKKAFKKGATANLCLVYLAQDHGSLENVTFRPSQEYEPITWTGTIQKPKPTKKKPSGTASPTASPS